MPQQSRDIVVELTHVGDGQVVATGARERSTEDLLVELKSSVRAPLCVEARNLRLLDGITDRRPGYVAVGTKPNAARVTGLFQALFDNDTEALLRFSTVTVHSFASGTYSAITAATPPTGAVTDFWDATMVRRAGSASPGNQVFAANGVPTDFIQAWTGAGLMTLVDATDAPRGVKSLSFFGGYCFAGNVVDTLSDRRNQRIQRSSVIDPLVWDDDKNGSGFIDLREDPFPVNKLTVLGGNQIVFKGNNQGGALYGGIETGRISEHIEYELLNPGVGIGLLLPRSFLLLEPALAWFVGHNGIFVWDGRGKPDRVADTVAKHILRRINQDALDAAFASYFPVTDEIVLHIPTGSNDVANEAWVWNRRENRTYGPWLYDDDLTAFALRAESGALTWSTFDYPKGWDTIPFSTWTAISGGAKGRLEPTYGVGDGKIVSTGDGDLATDDGADIDATYDPPGVAAHGRQSPQLGVLTFHDMMILREIAIRYRSDVAWTPTVAVSIDGGDTYVTVSDGVVLAESKGELRNKSYTATALPGLYAARVFHPRVQNVSGGALPLHSLRMRFEYGGDERVTA